MAKFFLLVLGFIVTTLFGAWSTEQIKIEFAHNHGYSPRYVKSFGRNVFNSEALGLEYDGVLAKHPSFEDAAASESWKVIASKDNAGHAEVEMPVKFFTVGFSVLGFMWLIGYVRKEPTMTWKHWASFFVSLCFMREVVLAAVNIFLAYPCGEAKAFYHLDINPFLAQKIILITGLIFLGLIVFTLPQKVRLRTVLAGAMGSVLGLFMWLFWLGPLVYAQ